MRLKRKNDANSYKPALNHIILYKKVPIFCRISDVSALIHNFPRNKRVRG